MIEQQKQNAINDFQRLRSLAELKSLSDYSLENPLSDEQYNRLMQLKKGCLG